MKYNLATSPVRHTCSAVHAFGGDCASATHNAYLVFLVGLQKVWNTAAVDRYVLYTLQAKIRGEIVINTGHIKATASVMTF